MKHLIPRFTAALLAVCMIPAATAQEPSLVNSNGTQIDTDAERAAFRAALGGSSSGSALFTDNPNALKNTFAKVMAGYTGAGLINVMTVGDSLSSGINQPNGGLDVLSQRWGIAGVGVGGIGVYGGPSVSGGASVSTTDYARWWTGNVAVVPAAGEAVYDYNTTAPIYCNRIRIYYLLEDVVGTFKVQTSRNGAAYVDEAGFTNVNCDNNGSLAAGIITLDKSSAANVGLFRAKIVGLTGTVRIIGALFDHTGMSGVVRTSLSKGSSDFTEWDDCPAAVVNTVVGSIAPDLMLFANVGTTTEAALDTMFGRLSTAYSATDKIIFGVWPNATGTEVGENPTLQAWAAENGAAFVSPTWHWPNHAALQAAGLSADDTHPTSTGYALMTTWAFERVLAGWPAVTPVLPGGGGSGVPNNILTAGRYLEPGSGIQTVNLSQQFAAPFIAVTQSASASLLLRDRSLTGAADQHAIYRSGGALITEAAGGSASYTSLNNTGQFEFFPTLTAGDNRLGRSANRWGRVFTNGIYLATSTKTGAYTATDRDHLLLGDATSAPFTMTLPATTSNSGLVLSFKKIDASGNAVTVAGATSTRGSGVTTNTSANISFGSIAVSPPIGATVTGTGIPANTTVVSSTFTTAVLSQAATASNTGLTFTFTESIDGAASISLSSQWSHARLQNNGGVWFLID